MFEGLANKPTTILEIVEANRLKNQYEQQRQMELQNQQQQLLIQQQALDNDFCHGFEKGYTTAYKKASNTSLDPMNPLCPLQPLKTFSDPSSDFEHGYLLGFQQGMEQGKNRNVR